MKLNHKNIACLLLALTSILANADNGVETKFLGANNTHVK